MLQPRTSFAPRDREWKEPKFLENRQGRLIARQKRHAGYLIHRLARSVDVRMREELKAIDVEFSLFTNLMALLEEDGINQRRLGEKQGFPEYFTSRNVDALVQAGFAERQADPASRRSFLVYLTPEGRRKAKLLPPIIRKVNDETLAELTESQREQVVGLLQKAARLDGQTPTYVDPNTSSVDN